MKSCPYEQPHRRHEWLDGVRREDCPGVSVPAESTPPLRTEELRDAIADILDICIGWTRSMTPTEKVAEIKGVATKAWLGDRG